MPAPGNGYEKLLQISEPPQRVVSLVPSLTESLFDLGLGSNVVGITDYCVNPEQALKDLPRLGGPKNPRIDDILAMEPDLVLANMEENNRQSIDSFRSCRSERVGYISKDGQGGVGPAVGHHRDLLECRCRHQARDPGIDLEVG